VLEWCWNKQQLKQELQGDGFRTVVRVTFVLAKVTKTAVAGRDPTGCASRFPVLLARCGTAPKLAALRQGRLSGRIGLRCSARSTARVDHELQPKQNHGNGNGNSNGNSNSAAAIGLRQALVCRLPVRRDP